MRIVQNKLEQIEASETVFNRFLHRALRDPPWLRRLKRTTKNPRLFILAHRGGFYQLGAWVKTRRSRRAFTELEMFHDNPYGEYPRDLKPLFALELRCRPVSVKTSVAFRKMRENREKVRIDHEKEEASRERMKGALKARGLSPQEILMATANSPCGLPSDHSYEMARRMFHDPKKKIISLPRKSL